MTRSEIHKKVGKEWALADDIVLTSQLIYLSGITGFNTYLNGKDQKDMDSVIRIKGKPRGIVFKFTNGISSVATAITYQEITDIAIVPFESYYILKVTTTTTAIYFGSDKESIFNVIDFLRSLKRIDIIEDKMIEVPKEIKGRLETFLYKHTDILPINIETIKASKTKRFLNYSIDLFMISLLYMLFFRDIESQQTSSVAFQSLTLQFLYYFILEYVFKTTVGKTLTQTKVVGQDGSKTNNIFLRTLCRIIPFEPFSFLFGPKGWHDHFSETNVIDIKLRKEQISTLK
ncbi:MAG: RDD family protein [Dokdonia sp.]